MIVPAETGHLKNIIDIEEKCFDNPWSYESFLNEINNSVSSNWVYIEKTNILGYLFGWFIEKDYQINNIAVISSFRRVGVAKKMIDNIIDTLDLRTIRLEVSTINRGAISLYENMGFKKNGIREKYYSDNSDAILYKLDLL